MPSASSGCAPPVSPRLYPDAFDRLIADAARLPEDEAYRFDTVIVDEGQDFSEAWRDLAFRHARPEARRIWLEDPMQNLYAREPVPLPGWVGIRSFANFRCRARSCACCRTSCRSFMPIEAASPIDASEVEILTYSDNASLLQALKEGIRLCYSESFRKGGCRRRHLQRPQQLAPADLRPHRSAHDAPLHRRVRPAWRPGLLEGDVLIESVYRFKGQSAPAVGLRRDRFRYARRQRPCASSSSGRRGR